MIVKDAIRFLQRQQALPSLMMRIFKNEGYVFDNLEDRWQKMAFTLYTEIVDQAEYATNILKDEERPMRCPKRTEGVLKLRDGGGKCDVCEYEYGDKKSKARD